MVIHLVKWALFVKFNILIKIEIIWEILQRVLQLKAFAQYYFWKRVRLKMLKQPSLKTGLVQSDCQSAQENIDL